MFLNDYMMGCLSSKQSRSQRRMLRLEDFPTRTLRCFVASATIVEINGFSVKVLLSGMNVPRGTTVSFPHPRRILGDVTHKQHVQFVVDALATLAYWTQHHWRQIGIAVEGHRRLDGRFHCIPKDTGPLIPGTHGISHICSSCKPINAYIISVCVCSSSSCSEIHIFSIPS